jgi:RNA polymerase sigma-70 factor (ECF subfamily)
MPALKADSIFETNGGRADESAMPLPCPLTVAELYERYARPLVERVRAALPSNLSGRTDAEDVVQSVFRRFIAHYSRGGYAVAEGEELWALLVMIAMNKIRDEGAYHRADRRDVRRTRSILPDSPDAAREPPDDAHLRLAIQDLIAPLPSDRRATVELRLAGHEVNEIAASVGRSKRTVERYLQQFRDRLETLI